MIESASDPLSPAPSARWYRVAGVIAVLGIVGALTWWPYAATRVHNAVYGFERTSAFGGRVTLAAGVHTFWLEGDCMSCHGNEPSEYREVADVSVVSISTGDELVLRPAPGRWIYNTGSLEGRALYLFEVAQPGEYGLRFTLDTSSPEWDNAIPAKIAIGAGEGLPAAIARPMVALAGGGIALSLALVAVTLVRRQRFYERRYPVSAR